MSDFGDEVLAEVTTPKVTHRPGPDAVDPGGAPGGLVFHLYQGDELVAVDAIVPAGRHGPSDGMVASALKSRRPSCLVVYDGDSGLRLTPGELAQVGLSTGQRL
ncbi:MAG TPA: hypothetical protein VJM49_13655 [Acidimicrobiales bacterium]|nr:hypothetical protein [Acidimicrobiales bacterium]